MTTNFTFNGLTLGTGTNFTINNFDPGDIDLRQSGQNASFRDGYFIFKQNYGVRILSMTIIVQGDTSEEFLNNVTELQTAFSRSDTALDFEYTLWDGRTRAGKAHILNFPQVPFQGGFTTYARGIDIALQAVFPYTFLTGGDSDEIVQVLQLEEPGGFDIPYDLPFDFASGGTGDSYTFDNDGQAEAILKVAFKGSVINPTLTNTSTGEVIQIETTLSDTDTVTVELKSDGLFVTDQKGVNFQEFYVGSTDSLFIPTGSNTFKFSANTFDTDARCTLTLNKRYI